ncbi:MAG: DUF2079 domain-containing protein [Lentimicrobium sp.]|nr:DUF2079 domain-containing protein [Lentimicrobium sp.]
MRMLKQYKGLALIIIIFGVIYSLISLVNHYNFRTYALDLGAYTNAMYDYIHFRWNDSAVFKEIEENLLADHFDLYLIFFSPLSLVFGTYTLLIVQIAAVLAGGAGVWFCFRLRNPHGNIPLYAALYFYLFFGVYSALSFDYHSNVVAASLLPWLFYSVRKRNLGAAALLLALMLVSKENVSLWLLFVCLGIAVEYRKETRIRNFMLFSSIICGAAFIMIVSLIMPAFSNSGDYPHFHYSFLGSNYKEAFLHLVSHPLESLKVLFVNHNNSRLGDYVKLELHLLLAVSGLPILLFRPAYLLMLIPVYFQKLFHDNYYMWGIADQYSIEFAPVMAIGIFAVISGIRKKRLAGVLSILVLLLTFASAFRVMDNTVIHTDKVNIRFYQKQHYTRAYDVAAVHKVLSGLPPDAIVSAQSPFLPHLALRDRIYQFPVIRDAEYIVLSFSEVPYPLTEAEFRMTTDSLEASGQWHVLYEGEIVILQRDGIY